MNIQELKEICKKGHQLTLTSISSKPLSFSKRRGRLFSYTTLGTPLTKNQLTGSRNSFNGILTNNQKGNTMKFRTALPFMIIIILCCLACQCSMAQAQERFAFSGAGYYDGAQAKGMAGLAIQIKDSKAYSLSEVTFGMVPKGTGNISIAGKDLQADFSTGIAYEVFNYKGYRLFGLGEPGLQQTGSMSSAMLKAGGGIHKMLNKNIGLAVFGTWKYAEDPVTRNAQWKVNPSVALIFKF